MEELFADFWNGAGVGSVEELMAPGHHGPWTALPGEGGHASTLGQARAWRVRIMQCRPDASTCTTPSRQPGPPAIPCSCGAGRKYHGFVSSAFAFTTTAPWTRPGFNVLCKVRLPRLQAETFMRVGIPGHFSRSHGLPE